MKSLVTISVVVLAAMSAAYFRRSYTPRVVAIGNFHQVAHKGNGIATVLDSGGGRRTLRFENFRTAQFPGLSVLLISADDAQENETVLKSDIVNLGPLKTTTGDQEYVLPPELDLFHYRAVTIWNEKYQVNFTTAPLHRD